MKSWPLRRPWLFAAIVMGFLQAFVVAGLVAARILEIPLISLDLPLMLLNALLAVVLLGRLGWWSVAGFNRPAQWRNLHFLILPVVLLVVPALVIQPGLPPVERLVVLAVVTLLIGFQEEAIFRGVLLRAFMPRGVMQAVLISALLFGIIHANSFLVGRDPLFVWAQIVASFLGAIGLGALRIRINSIWPLILLHAFNDIVQFIGTGGIEAQEVALYIPVLKIVISGIMALYGIFLLRGYRAPSAALVAEEARESQVALT